MKIARVLMPFLLTAGALLLCFGFALEAADNETVYALYDKDWNLTCYMKGAAVYDKDWQLRYYVREGTVYDKDWQRQYIIKDTDIYDKYQHLQYRIKEFTPPK